jgi:uncharacterized protein
MAAVLQWRLSFSMLYFRRENARSVSDRLKETTAMNDSTKGSGQNSTQQEPPKIEFPCEDYPVKVMGDAGGEFHAFAVEVMVRHAADLDQARITVKGSRNGRFQSITFMITATGVDQLQALHQELIASPMTKMVL